MKLLRIVILSLLLALAQAQLGFAQTPCEQDFSEAVDLYNKGFYGQAALALEKLVGNTDRLKRLIKQKSKIHDLINQCSLSDEARKQAYKLLIAAYSELDEKELAIETTREFRRKYPNYEVNTTSDPYLFVSFFNNISQRPKLQFGLWASWGMNHENVLKTNTVWQSLDYTQPYESSPRYNGGLDIKFFPHKNFTVSFGGAIRWMQYSRSLTNDTVFTLNFSEEFAAITVPLQVDYTFPVYRKFHVSVGLGLSYMRIISTHGYATYRTYVESPTSGVAVVEKTENDINLSDTRNLSNWEAQMQAELMYRYKNFDFYSQIVLSRTLKLHSTGNALTSDFLYYDWMYADDDFNFKSVQLKFGVRYTLSHFITHKYQR